MQRERANECSGEESPMELLGTQPSHVLLALSNSYSGGKLCSRRQFASIVREQHYEQHETDVTCGRHKPFPFRYLRLFYLSLDGAEHAEEVISEVHANSREEGGAALPATWLFYPAGEKVGRPAVESPSMLTIAFANAVSEQRTEFREWYVTRHIRHALNIPALVGGQCFERTLFQRTGGAECTYAMIAIYEQEGTVESIIDSFKTLLPSGKLNFPTMDKTPGRFAECVFRPIE
jgi:hypothetical protein